MMFLCFIVAFMLCVKIANAYTDEAIADQIVNLPGIDPIKDQVKFNQFSGYLNINSNTGKRIHYWMVEASEVDPATAPGKNKNAFVSMLHHYDYYYDYYYYYCSCSCCYYYHFIIIEIIK